MEATIREATSSILLECKAMKNQRRKQRRQRAKQKCVIQRSMLLQLRPSTDVFIAERDGINLRKGEHAAHTTLHQRLQTLEVAVGNLHAASY